MSILHHPLGQEHPYEQLPEERFPRHPLADEPFTIGIVIRPLGAAQQVIVHQQIDGVTQTPVEAVLMSDWQAQQEEGVGAEFLERLVRIEQDVWQAPLIAPPAGQTLTYWIEAGGERSEVFTLQGEAWHSGGGWSAEGNTLTFGAALSGRDTLPGMPAILDVEWLGTQRIRITCNASADERFFGLGERFNALDQRGHIMDIRVYEQYKNQGERTYMPIPFLLSSAGYGLYVQSSRWMQFDLAATHADRWTLEADLGPDGVLPLTWFTGADPITLIGQFATQTGPVVLPPQWAFGLWMSGNEWNSQAKIEQEVRASFEHGITPAVIVIEAWSDETTFYIWNDAQYTPRPGSDGPRYSDFTFPPDGKWTDPKGMIDWLHEQSIKILLWQIPVMKILEQPHAQHEADRAYFEQQGYGVKHADGSLHTVRPFWFRGGYLWDVTNLAARDWWLNKRAYLLDEMGIDGFKTDGGEHLWGTDVRFADGRGGDEVWNEYPRHYTEAYYNFANRKREAVTFSRAGFIGSQRSPLHWAGDENSTWEAFQHSILAGLSAGISGIPFWGFDFGGFSGPLPSAELYLRAAAMATFCPVMQYHSEYNAHRQPSHDRTPWNIQDRTGDEHVLPLFRFFASVRQKLMPYIWREAQHSAATGEPFMRALKLTEARASDYQYFFGRDLLVCPIVEADVTVWRGYLPAGRWTSLWDDTVYEGGQDVEMDAPLDRIPVFVRDGADLGVLEAFS